MSELAYISGDFCDLSAARVPVEDRGFQFADGVYEGIVAYDGVPFRLDEHLVRLQHSLRQVRIEFDAARIGPLVREGVSRAGFPDTFIYVQVTRGVAPRGHLFPPGAPPTLVMTFKAKPEVSAELRAQGVSLITRLDDRWEHCDVKTIMLLANVLAQQAARDRGAYDALLVSPQQEVYETTQANLFLVRDGVLITPQKCNRILPGITRDYVLECAAQMGMPTREQRVLLDELYDAEEAFITSSTKELLGVSRVNERAIGSGRTGAVTKKLHAAFHDGVRRTAEAG